MAILNPQLLEGFDTNDTNSTSPSSLLLDDGYAFGDIPASANHNFMFAQIYTYLNFLKETGISRWDSSLTYKKQAMIVRQEKIYFSIADANIANDPTTTSDLSQPTPSWISLDELIIAPFYTSSIVNAGSKSTINAVSYFGTVAALKNNAFYGIRIKTGTIDFPGNVEVSIDGLSVKTATLALPDYNTQVALVIGLRYIGGGTDAFQSVITSENIVDTFRAQSIQDTLDAIKSAAFINASQSGTASTVVQRDGSGDIVTRLFRSTHAVQPTPSAGAAIGFRENTSSDNFIKFMSLASMLNWLSIYTKSESDARYLLEANNLSDLVNDATARTNLDVYSKSESDTAYMKKAQNLNDVASKATSRTNLDVYSKGETDTVADNAVTTSAVLAATAGAAVGIIGTYALLSNEAQTVLSAGETLAGSSLSYANTYNGTGTNESGRSNISPDGAWRLMGQVGTYNDTLTSTDFRYMTSLWLRIS